LFAGDDGDRPADLYITANYTYQPTGGLHPPHRRFYEAVISYQHDVVDLRHNRAIRFRADRLKDKAGGEFEPRPYRGSAGSGLLFVLAAFGE